ncbi:MAG TPA: SAM-dependent methyltransferase [Bacteroidales bacterium]|jgi:16S rRNA (cytidine1402-2'-O)-methyltransferase|nr:SAM-dependent methyltransferase [Bacteroidales bacterium]
MKTPTLYLIPAPLAPVPVTAVLPEDHIALVRTLTHFVVEELRTARRYLSALGLKPDDLHLDVLNEHTSAEEHPALLAPLRQGTSMGLLSEAGYPAVADPGAELVALAHKEQFRVVPLVGPSSIGMALMASGLNGQQFAFHGYLPVQALLRDKKIKELERQSAKEQQTQIFMETPYRNASVFEALLKCCAPQTKLTLAIHITHPQAFICTKTIEEWKHNRPDFEEVYRKKPCVYLLMS